jgi:hypothetical protein
VNAHAAMSGGIQRRHDAGRGRAPADGGRVSSRDRARSPLSLLPALRSARCLASTRPSVYWDADCTRCDVTFGPYTLDQLSARALEAAVETSDESASRYARRLKQWSVEEDAQLGAEFDDGLDKNALAKLHGRSAWAIEWRLFKLGKVGEMPMNPWRGPTQPARTAPPSDNK